MGQVTYTVELGVREAPGARSAGQGLVAAAGPNPPARPALPALRTPPRARPPPVTAQPRGREGRDAVRGAWAGDDGGVGRSQQPQRGGITQTGGRRSLDPPRPALHVSALDPCQHLGRGGAGRGTTHHSLPFRTAGRSGKGRG